MYAISRVTSGGADERFRGFPVSLRARTFADNLAPKCGLIYQSRGMSDLHIFNLTQSSRQRLPLY